MFYMNNTKLASVIFGNKRNHAADIKCHLNTGQKSAPIYIYYKLLDKYKEPITEDFTYFDRVVYDGIYTLYKDNQSKFNKFEFKIGKLLRTISSDKKQTLTKEIKQRLYDSIRKMNSCLIYIDFTEEKNSRENNVKDCIIKNHLLPVVPVDGHIDKDGIPIKYRLISLPPLFEYAELNKQIITVPKLMFDCGVRNTVDNLKIKHYLVRRLELMRNNNNHVFSKKIIYHRIHGTKLNGIDGMMCDLDFIDLNPDEYIDDNRQKILAKEKQMKAVIAKVLEYFTEQGYIFAYRDNSDQSVGVELLPDASGKYFLLPPQEAFSIEENITIDESNFCDFE